jgi:hypothetical protein
MPSRSHRAAICLLCIVAVLVGCGSGDQSQPTAEGLRVQQDQIRAELLLNRAEIVRAELYESEERLKPNSPHLRTIQSVATRRIRALSKECAIGDGLEPCPKREELEAIVQELP